MAIRIGNLLDPNPILDILKQVDQYRYSLEDRSYPRKEVFKGKIISSLRQVNTEEDIRRGVKYITFSGRERKIKINSIYHEKWRVLRKAYSTTESPWLLVKLKGGNLIQLDLDAHDKIGDFALQEQNRDQMLLDVIDFLYKYNIDFFVTTSPGDLVFDERYSTEKILNGYYIWIKTNKNFSSEELTDICSNLVNEIKKQTSHNIEHNWLKLRSRNVRLFGQPFVDIINYYKKNIKRDYQSTFADNSLLIQERANKSFSLWEKLEPCNLDQFVPQGNICFKKHVSDNSIIRKRSINTTNIKNINSNAFYRLIGTKGKNDSIISKIILKYEGKEEYLNLIIEEAKQSFKEVSIRAGFYDHVNNDNKLTKLVTSAAQWFIKKYNNSKNVLKRESNNEHNKDIIKYLKNSKFNSVQIKAVIKMFGLCKRWNGFVSSKCIYGPNGVCTRKVWKSIKHLFKIVANHSIKRNKCRQYKLDESIISKDKQQKTTQHYMKLLLVRPVRQKYRFLCATHINRFLLLSISKKQKKYRPHLLKCCDFNPKTQLLRTKLQFWLLDTPHDIYKLNKGFSLLLNTDNI